jgi:hypothetical protein
MHSSETPLRGFQGSFPAPRHLPSACLVPRSKLMQVKVYLVPTCLPHTYPVFHVGYVSIFKCSTHVEYTVHRHDVAQERIAQPLALCCTPAQQTQDSGIDSAHMHFAQACLCTQGAREETQNPWGLCTPMPKNASLAGAFPLQRCRLVPSLAAHVPQASAQQTAALQWWWLGLGSCQTANNTCGNGTACLGPQHMASTWVKSRARTTPT